jgi:hypothetical protein
LPRDKKSNFDSLLQFYSELILMVDAVYKPAALPRLICYLLLLDAPVCYLLLLLCDPLSINKNYFTTALRTPCLLAFPSNNETSDSLMTSGLPIG